MYYVKKIKQSEYNFTGFEQTGELGYWAVGHFAVMKDGVVVRENNNLLVFERKYAAQMEADWYNKKERGNG